MAYETNELKKARLDHQAALEAAETAMRGLRHMAGDAVAELVEAYVAARLNEARAERRIHLLKTAPQVLARKR